MKKKIGFGLLGTLVIGGIGYFVKKKFFEQDYIDDFDDDEPDDLDEDVYDLEEPDEE